MRAFVVSQPKAGTYLTVELLCNFGFSKALYHFSTSRIDCYDGEGNFLGNVKWRFRDSINLIKDHEVGAGHIPWSDESKEILSEFKVVLVTRPFGECRSSWIKMASRSDRLKVSKKGIRNFRNLYLAAGNWINDRSVFHITFEELIHGDTNRIDMLQSFLFGRVRFDSTACIKSALAADTLTKSIERKSGQ